MRWGLNRGSNPGVVGDEGRKDPGGKGRARGGGRWGLLEGVGDPAEDGGVDVNGALLTPTGRPESAGRPGGFRLTFHSLCSRGAWSPIRGCQ